MRKSFLFLTATVTSVPGLLAELKLPAIVGDHMVLQQNQANPIWGWDTPGTDVTVSFARQHYSSIAGSDGRWTVTLNSLPSDAKPQTLTVEGSSRREIQDVLIGEVWMCSGQSNMGFTLARDWNGDLEAAASDLPGIRLIQAPLLGTQEFQSDFRPGEKGQWRLANPATAIRFSAIGFLFGRYLHQILHVAVGLIDNAWGGSSAEAWVRRSTLEQDARFQLLMESTVKRETTLQSEKGQADFQRTMDQWKAAAAQAIAEKTPPPPRPEDWLAGEKPNPGDSSWAELREAQTQTMKLPNTGQAVIIDLGEGKDIHPRNKHDVAARLVRWALVQDYGMSLPYRSPEFKSMAIAGNRATITFDMFGGSLRAFDVAEARGFAICGADRVWHLAQGKVVGKDRVEVWSDEIAAPVAVRYGWADNPVLNLFSDDGLPVTPFRTDDFSMTTAPKPKL